MQSSCYNQHPSGVSSGSILVRPDSVSLENFYFSEGTGAEGYEMESVPMESVPIETEDNCDFFYSEGKTFFRNRTPVEKPVEKPVHRAKIVIVGSRLSGKTSFVNAIKNQPFNSSYEATRSMQVNLQKIESNKGDITLSLFDHSPVDIPSLEKEKQLWKGASGFLVMFDLFKSEGFKKAWKWINAIRNMYSGEGEENKCPPIAVCGNRYDGTQVINVEEKYFKFFPISVRRSQNIYSPLLFLLRQKLGEDLEFFFPEKENIPPPPEVPKKKKVLKNKIPVPPKKVPKQYNAKERYEKIRRNFSNFPKPMLSPLLEEGEFSVKPVNYTPTITKNSSPEHHGRVKNKKTMSFTNSNPEIAIKRSFSFDEM